MFQTHSKLFNFNHIFYCRMFIQRMQILNNTKKNHDKL